MAWTDYLDFDKSGGLNFGDVSAGLSSLGSGISGLLGSTGSVGKDGVRTNTSGLLGGLMDNKDLIGLGGQLLGGYAQYQNAQSQADYAKGLLDLNRQQINATEAERQRQIDKEEEAQQSMMTGFTQSGLSNYYGV